MKYEHIVRGEVVALKPAWKVNTAEGHSVDAIALSRTLIMRPEIGDTVRVASFQGVWKILDIEDVV